MRKGRDGEKKNGKEKKRKRRMRIVATTSLPAVDRPNADHWNAARSCQNDLALPIEFKIQFACTFFNTNVQQNFSRGVFQSINIQKKKMTVEEYEKHSKSDRYCTPKFTDFEVCIIKDF